MTPVKMVPVHGSLFTGGIRRRLRDRDLLRKRKAEAEAKETNQWVFG